MRRARVGIFLAAVWGLYAAGPPGAAAQESAPSRFGLEDLRLLLRLSDPQVSPDGRRVVLHVSRAHEETNRWDTQLLEIEIAGGAQRLLSSRRGIAQARWSPSGDRLAFLALPDDGPETGGRQIHVLPMVGGEAWRLTEAPGGVQSFAWRPDGREIAFVAEEPEASSLEAGPERHNDAFEVGNDHYLTRSRPVPSRIWLVPVASGPGPARQLTQAPFNLATSFGPGPLSWSPGGDEIAFVPIRGRHSGDADQTAVHVVEVATGNVRPLTGRRAFEGGAAFSPDGTRIAYSYPRDGVPANLDEIHVAPRLGGEGASLSHALDRSVRLYGWLHDGDALLLGGPDGTSRALWVQPLEGSPRKLDLGEVKATGGVALGRSDAIAFIGVTSGHPAELYHMASPSSPPRRLTAFHDEIAGRALGHTETIEWEGPDGHTGDGVLVFPPGFDEARRYPLVLLIHGGPTAASTEAFSARAQLLAAQGWLIFQPNYRGSNHRGNAYQSAIAGDCAEGPGRDVMAGVEAVKRRGFVDADRIAVSGWSYGGYMTAWLIGRYPGVWRAAVAGAAPVDATDMAALSDLNVMVRHCLTSSPWVGSNLQGYLEQSPISHLAKVRTPTLVMSKVGDQRVTITGSYKLFHALRDNGVPVQFIAYPGPGHSPSDPVRARDVHRHWIAWLARYLDEDE